MKTLGTILFAGGGTGGHLFPSLAVAERLLERPGPVGVHFVCSNRPIDQKILTDEEVPFTCLPIRPLPEKTGEWPGFVWRFARSVRKVKRLIQRHRVRCVVATGGFVSGPAVVAANRMKVPVLMVNLDAVPGKANRWLASRCQRVFTTQPEAKLPVERVEWIPTPLRRVSIGGVDRPAARKALGFAEHKPLLLITGASQGAESIDRLLTHLVQRDDICEALRPWQIFHLAGGDRVASIQDAYLKKHLDATVMPFCNRMGLAWSAASLAISRAGAGSVAEIVANAVPALFLPYPYHKDQHQKRNAQPLADAEGGLLFEDLVDPEKNEAQLLEPLLTLLRGPEKRERMRQNLHTLQRGDGAEELAKVILACCGQKDTPELIGSASN